MTENYKDCDLYKAGVLVNRQGVARLFGQVIDHRNPPKFDDLQEVTTSPVENYNEAVDGSLIDGAVYVTRSGTRYCVHLRDYNATELK